MPHLSGHAEEHHDHQGVPAPLLRRLHHHSTQIWVGHLNSTLLTPLYMVYISVIFTRCVKIVVDTAAWCSGRFCTHSSYKHLHVFGMWPKVLLRDDAEKSS